MLELRVDKKFDLSKIRMDFTKELNEAGQLIKADIFTGVGKGTFDGKAFKKLSKSTIEYKKEMKYKYPNKPLIATDTMRKLNINKATKTNQEVNIFPGTKQKYKGSGLTPMQVGYRHQTGSGVPVREWFGISRDAFKKILRAMELRIEKEIRRA